MRLFKSKKKRASELFQKIISRENQLDLVEKIERVRFQDKSIIPGDLIAAHYECWLLVVKKEGTHLTIMWDNGKTETVNHCELLNIICWASHSNRENMKEIPYKERSYWMYYMGNISAKDIYNKAFELQLEKAK
jgi:hypothetical protein